MEKGDVVKLNSGGPAMTVQCVYSESNRVECIWFTEEGRVETREFNKELLHSISPLAWQGPGPDML